MDLAKRFHRALMVGFFGVAATGALGAETHSWKAESTLDVIFDQDPPEIRHVERKVWFRSEGQETMPMRYLVLETETRSSYRWGWKGTEGTVAVKVWRLRGKSPERELLYAVEVPGVDVSAGSDFIEVGQDADYALAVNDYYYSRTGKFAFAATGKPSVVSFDGDDMGSRRLAAFSPWSRRIPKGEGKRRAIGVIAYLADDKMVEEVLLTADNEEQGGTLRDPYGQHQTLDWIDVRTGHPPDNSFQENFRFGFADGALRLRFHGTSLDILLPVTPTGIDRARLTLPPGLSLVRLDPAN